MQLDVLEDTSLPQRPELLPHTKPLPVLCRRLIHTHSPERRRCRWYSRRPGAGPGQVQAHSAWDRPWANDRTRETRASGPDCRLAFCSGGLSHKSITNQSQTNRKYSHKLVFPRFRKYFAHLRNREREFKGIGCFNCANDGNTHEANQNEFVNVFATDLQLICD